MKFSFAFQIGKDGGEEIKHSVVIAIFNIRNIYSCCIKNVKQKPTLEKKFQEMFGLLS